MKDIAKTLFVAFVFAISVNASLAVQIFYNGSAKGRLGPLSGGKQAQMVSFIDQLREKEPELLLLCAGDMLGPCLTSEIDGGQQMVEVMNRCGYEASGLGPHDLFAGWANFCEKASRAKFPFVCANIKYVDLASGKERSPDPVKPWIVCNRGGKRIFITGVMSASFEKNRPAWPKEIKTTSPKAALEAIKEHAQNADYVVILSTRRYYSNVRLLDKTPWVDILISRTGADQRPFGVEVRDVALPDGRRVLWCHNGLETLGSVLLGRQQDGFKSSVRTHSLPKSMEADSVVSRAIARIEKKAQLHHQEVLATLSPDEASNFPITFLQALRHSLKAEIGLFHRAAFSPVKVPEKLTYEALRKSYPYHSRVALAQVSGKRLKELWKEKDRRLVGSGGIYFVGLSERRGKLLVNGRLVRKKDTYRVATTEYLALGLNKLLPRQKKAVGKKKVYEAVAHHLKTTTIAKRPVLYRRLANRPVSKRSVKFDWAISSLQFDGAASQYQYADESAEGRRSDIPGFVGRPFRQTAFYLDFEALRDKPKDDLTFRFESSYQTYKGNIRTDLTELILRYEEKDPFKRSNWFSELSLAATLEKPSDPTREWPLFGKVVFGRAWKMARNSKVLAGVGFLGRFSQVNSPKNTGLNLAYEIEHKFNDRFELDLGLEYFASMDSDQLHVADAKVAFRLDLGRGISYVTRYIRYLWRDDIINNSAHRKELFMGLGFTRKLRRF